MTEEIIIDCAFYKDGVCASPINKTCEYCKNINVSKCYHKQLKRLEQENKELKKEVKQIGSNFIKKGDYARELEQENKELGRKAFLAEQNVQTTAATFCEKDNKIIELEQENKELKEKVKVLDKMTGIFSARLCNKYRSALEEIRKIAISAFAKQRPYKEDFAEIENVVNKILNKG